MKNKNLSQIVSIELKKRKHFDFKKISVAFPYFDNNEIVNALESLLNLRISQGEKTKKFENKFSKYINMPYAAAVNSGSSANLIALSALIDNKKIKLGDEIIVPSTTFATVVSPIYQLGLVPVYLDVNNFNWNIDTSNLEKSLSKKTKAIFAVHTLGFPCDMVKINAIAKKYNLIVIEDCCEAHGATIGKFKVGSLSHISTWSFFVAHNITTGEGGMILTKDKKIYESIISLREFGRLVNYKKRFTSFGKMKNYDSRYMFMKNGYNVRLNDIASAIGIEQLKKLDKINVIRRKNAKYLIKNLSKHKDHFYFPKHNKDEKCAYYGFPILVTNSKIKRSKLCSFLEENNIETRSIMGGCLPDQPAFIKENHRIFGSLTNSKKIKDNAFFIGVHSALKPKHLNHIIKVFNEFINQL